MATALVSAPGAHNALAGNQQADPSKQDTNFNIPEIIEEHRKDSDGKVSVHKYLRGKLLGKVSSQYSICMLSVLPSEIGFDSNFFYSNRVDLGSALLELYCPQELKLL